MTVGLVLRLATFAPSCWAWRELDQLLFVWVLPFSSLTSLPISVFSAPALLAIRANLLFHTLLLIVTVLFMHMVLFQVFVLLRSVYIVSFFPLTV